jgi:nitrate reductase beta subunit
MERLMNNRNRKKTPAEKAEKKRLQQKYMTIFVDGNQKRVKREPTVDGIPVDEFIRMNADPIWLMQNEMYEELHEWESNAS